MAKRQPKGKKKSLNKSETLTKLLIIQAIRQIVKMIVEIFDKHID